MLVTVIAAIMAFADIAAVAQPLLTRNDWLGLAQQALFATIVVFLVYGNIVYQLTRAAHYRRRAIHQPATLDRLRALHRDNAPRISVLVPAYKEEEHVVLQTLLSAALLEYPSKRIVLLIDDPPAAHSVEDRENLARMRALPRRVQQMLEFPARHFHHEYEGFAARKAAGTSEPEQEASRLSILFETAAVHLGRIGDTVAPGSDHVSRFFRDTVIGMAERDLRQTGEVWRSRSDEGEFYSPDGEAIERDFRRLASYFSADVASFERKTYRNLSHEPNKAMNLNAYIDLMGRFAREVRNPDNTRDLVHCAEPEASCAFADAEYVVTLDADSLLLNDYALRLVEFLERPENHRIAIAQTPYSSFPEAPGTLERIAGITTDIQHIVHQGFTRFGSTYWVGANAMIRKAALADIVTTEHEGEKTVRKYIQDRTVIEDTESSVDLLLTGWSLYNYPARLAYSATPPDFGSLLIQRRRWANGGLIILPKLLRYVFQAPLRTSRVCNGFIQAHYLVSLSASCFGVLLMLLFPFEESMRSWWLPITAAPYFLLYGIDMRALGRRWSDLLRVYALNLALVPVHLGGVLASVRQLLTGRKTPFGRTPKVVSRTAMPAIYVAAVFGLALYCFAYVVFDVLAQRWAHGAFALLNGGFFAYGAIAFIGLQEGIEDLGLRRARPVPLPQPAPSTLGVPGFPTDVPAPYTAPRHMVHDTPANAPRMTST
jgi:cellulose synthase/poly-beta-1,6-N-acetylglucosamine synthase-like glycosyltransferase